MSAFPVLLPNPLASHETVPIFPKPPQHLVLAGGDMKGEENRSAGLAGGEADVGFLRAESGISKFIRKLMGRGALNVRN